MLPKIIVCSFLAVLLCFWMRNDLSARPQPLPSLANEPRQETTYTQPFSATVGDHTYHIEPQYNYDLYGLVVSYRLHDGDFGIHHDWGDYLNVADVCVVWADNAFSLDLTRYDFRNGEYTCYVETGNEQAWKQFRMEQLSNNHLITDNAYLRNRISELRIGDQIHIKGMLASYSSNNGNPRGTSTTRTDTGNGACETIYVTGIERIAPYHNPWRYGMYLAIIVLAISLELYLKLPHRARE